MTTKNPRHITMVKDKKNIILTWKKCKVSFLQQPKELLKRKGEKKKLGTIKIQDQVTQLTECE